MKLGFGALAAALAASAAQAQVQMQIDPALERQVDDAYRLVLQQPQDLALWSRYAQLQVRSGNYEGGIGALERLMLQPNYPPELPLEIAVLYYRLGSYAMAEAMLRRALDDARLQGEQRLQAQRLQHDVAKRNQRSQLSGNLTFGLRHQTNPAYRTSESEVLSAGLLGPLAPDQRPDSDWDANLGVRLQHKYDLQFQNSAAISTTFGAYLVDFHSASGSSLQAVPTKPYDLALLDLTTGIEFRPAPVALSTLTVRPHVALSHVVAQQHSYLRSEGVGIDATLRPNERTLADVTVDVHRRTFEQRVDLANAAEVSGHLVSLRGRVMRELAPGHALSADFALRSNSTYRRYYDYDQQELRVTYARSYGSPLAAVKGQWTTAVWLGALHRSYDEADPSVHPGTARKDEEWRVGLSQTIPLAEQLYGLVSIEHSRNRSNLPNFRFRNTSVSASLLRTF